MKLDGSTKNMLKTIGGLVAIYIVMQILSATGMLSNTLSNILPLLCMYATVAVALNICVGYLGDLSLGHAGFMSVGAFVSASFTQAAADAIPNNLLRFIIAMILGVLAAAIAGFLIGIPVLRLSGDYLAIVTLAFGEIIKGILNVTYFGKDSNGLHLAFLKSENFKIESDGTKIIDGAKGIMRTPHITTFTIAMIVLIIALVVATFLVNSRTGRAIQAIRDNRIAAQSVGIRVTKYKLIGFTISAAIAGSAGVLYAHSLSSMTSNKFDFNMSILILVFVVLGGLGSFRGSIIAAALLTLLPELLRGLSDYRMLIYSILLIVMMLFNWAPGIVDWRKRHLSKLSKLLPKKSGKEA